jgi:hypothetical protein
MPATAYAPLRSLGETQLQIQFTLLSAYDARAIGLLATNAALAAAVIASADMVGRLWWASLIGLLVASLPCIVALSRGGESMALDVDRAFDLPVVLAAAGTDEALARSVARAVIENESIIQAKQRWTLVGLILTGVTICTAFIPLVIR